MAKTVSYYPPKGIRPDINSRTMSYAVASREWRKECEKWWKDNGLVLDSGPFFCVACGTQLQVIGHMTTDFLGCPNCGEFTLYFFDIVEQEDKMLAVYRPPDHSDRVDLDELETFKQSLQVSRQFSGR